MSNLDPSFTIGSQLVEPLRVAPQAQQEGCHREGARAARPRRHPRPEAHVRRLPARDLGRHGAARAHRRRGLDRPRPDHRRRADHGARRDRAGRGARPAARPAGGASHGDAPRDPQLRRRRRPLRPRVGHAGAVASSRPAPSARSSTTQSTRTPSRCSPRSSTRVPPRPPLESLNDEEHSDDAILLLDVEDLEVEYPGKGFRAKPFRALKGVSLDIQAGETVGLVGESGSGKTTLGRAVLGLAPVTGGTVRYRDRDISHLHRKERRELCQRDPGGLPGPLLLAQPVAHDRADPHRAAHRPRRLERGVEAARRRPPRPRGLPGDAREPPAARVLGRPAAAHRHRPGARARPEAHRVRRARVGARPLDPGAGARPLHRDPGAHRASPTCSSRTTWPSSATSAIASR